MSGIVFRMRCPVCGMVVWQKRVNTQQNFEILGQQSFGRGKLRWLRHLDPRGEAVRIFKLLLARRLRQIADRLEREARSKAYISTSVERCATVMNVLRSPLTSNAERLGSTSSVVAVVR